MSETPQIATRPPPHPVARLALFDREHETHRLLRRSVAVEGVTYRLLLAVPKAAAPAAGFPILYLLDGNAAFDLMSAEQLAACKGIVIAGIAHDDDRRFDPPSRSRDYTPSRNGQGPRPDPDRPERLIGGADVFLRRLVGPIAAAAEAGIPADPVRRMIFGHSLAGMFALHAMLSLPGAFRRVAAASPSIWWGGEYMLALEARTPPFDARADILVTLGDSERRSSPAGPHWDGPAPHTLEMIRRLEARDGLHVTSHILEGLGHAATLPASLPLVLDFAARPFPATS